MKRIWFVIVICFTCPVFSQDVELLRIYNDTSLYFIHQVDSSKPVSLSTSELVEVEEHLVRAINEFVRSRQQYADSINPKKKKNRYQAQRINIDDYFFQFIPKINKEGQKEVWINGDLKDYFIVGGTRKKPIFDGQWKKKFINGHAVADGGSGFIYLFVNLTLKSHGQLTMNGEG